MATNIRQAMATRIGGVTEDNVFLDTATSVTVENTRIRGMYIRTLIPRSTASYGNIYSNYPSGSETFVDVLNFNIPDQAAMKNDINTTSFFPDAGIKVAGKVVVNYEVTVGEVGIYYG